MKLNIKDFKIGDVVVSTKVYGYEFGKSEDKFKPRFEFGLPSYQLVQLSKSISNNITNPKVFVAPIAVLLSG